MPKYRLLSMKELQELEKEFVDFLVLNGIVAEDWEKLKREDQPGASHIIELFSDVVFESIMRKVKFLELRTRHEVKVFQCLKNKLVMVGMSSNADPGVDFTDPDFINKATTHPPSGIKVYTTEKEYDKVREIELFEMIQAGAVVVDNQLFKSLCLALASS